MITSLHGKKGGLLTKPSLLLEFLGIQRTDISTMDSIDNNPTANILLNRRKLNAFPSKLYWIKKLMEIPEVAKTHAHGLLGLIL